MPLGSRPICGLMICVVGVVPVKNTYEHMPDIALDPLGGRPLIDHTLDQVAEAGIGRAVLLRAAQL